METTSTRPRIPIILAAVLGVVIVVGAVLVDATPDTPSTAPLQNTSDELTTPKAVILGLVEGITEYLPISSTGHLLVTQRILDIGTTEATKDAADTYAIAIQLGAILAVLVLYRRRIATLFPGITGRNPEGRRLLIALVTAFIPAAVLGLAFESTIKDYLLSVGPVIIAWAIGGVALVVLSVRRILRPDHPGLALEQMTFRQAAIIGMAQVVAMWPGTSRSLVTIVAAVLVGMSLAAAVEFSFLLGLVTLGAATVFEIVKNGSQLFDTFGVLNPLIGLLVALVSAAAAVRWMVTYLQRRDMAIFGWYRLAAAALTLVLIAAGTI